MGADGAYYPYTAVDAAHDHDIAFLQEGVTAPQVLGSQALEGFGQGLIDASGNSWSTWSMVGLGLGLAGAAIALASGGGGGGSRKGAPATPVETIDPTPPVKPVEPIDTAPTDLVIDWIGDIVFGDSTTITGAVTGANGGIVTISNNGKVIGTATVGDNGKWELALEGDKALESGQQKITATVTSETGVAADEPAAPVEFTVKPQQADNIQPAEPTNHRKPGGASRCNGSHHPHGPGVWHGEKYSRQYYWRRDPTGRTHSGDCSAGRPVAGRRQDQTFRCGLFTPRPASHGEDYRL
jgi:hypothetical protein